MDAFPATAEDDFTASWGDVSFFVDDTVKNRCIELLSAGPGGPKQIYFSTHENKDSF